MDQLTQENSGWWPQYIGRCTLTHCMLGTSVVSVCRNFDAPLPGSTGGSICGLYPDGAGARAVAS